MLCRCVLVKCHLNLKLCVIVIGVTVLYQHDRLVIAESWYFVSSIELWVNCFVSADVGVVPFLGLL